MSDQVTAQVILRARDGTSILDADGAITSAEVSRYKVGEDIVREASRRLAALGFEVVQAGAHSLTISGAEPLFERVFKTRLEAKAGRGPSGALAFEAKDPITIPDDLSPIVAAVALPTPPELFP